jgi:hypothetical protein
MQRKGDVENCVKIRRDNGGVKSVTYATIRVHCLCWQQVFVSFAMEIICSDSGGACTCRAINQICVGVANGGVATRSERTQCSDSGCKVQHHMQSNKTNLRWCCKWRCCHTFRTYSSPPPAGFGAGANRIIASPNATSCGGAGKEEDGWSVGGGQGGWVSADGGSMLHT